MIVVTFPETVSGRFPKTGTFAVPLPENDSFVFTTARSPRSVHAYPRTLFDAIV